MQAQPLKHDSEPVPESAGERSRGDILSAAAQCFMERGYTETSIDDVARRLNSTKGRIYHHFSSKADLFAAIYRAGMDKDYEAIAEGRAHSGAALERLTIMMRAHVRQIIYSKPFQRVVWQGVQLLMRGATTPELRDELTRLSVYRDDYEQIFREAMVAALAARGVKAASLSVSTTMMFVTLNSPIFWYSPRPGETDADIEQLVEQVVSFALGGLGLQEQKT